jgi:autotransporter-associated beta strand protein
LGACLIAVPQVSAQVVYWDGGAGTGAWGTGTNWSTNVVPGDGASLVFEASSANGQYTITLGADRTTAGITFNSAAGTNAFTFTGNTLTINAGGITNNDADTQTFSSAVSVNSAQTWNATSGGLAFNTVALANDLTLSGTANISIAGTLTNSGGSRTISNSSTGAVTLGNINLSDNNTARTLTISGTGTTTVAGVIADGGSSAGALSKTGTGTLVLSGANTYTGTTTVSAGLLSIQSAGALGTAANASATTVANGATLQLANNITTTNAGTLVLNGTGVGGAGALQSVGGNNTWNGSVALASDATISSATAGNTLFIDDNYVSAQTLTMGNHTLTVDGPGDTWINSNVGVAGDTGGLIKNGTGTLTLYGYNTYYTGATAVNAGSLELVVGPFSSGWYGINGPLTIGTGSLTSTATVEIWSPSNHPSGWSYDNQISPTSAVTINSDGMLNIGTSTSLGSLTLNGGQVSISSSATVTPTGDITSNVNSAHATSLISGGTLILGTGNFNVARDSTLASDLTISSSIGGTANLNKNGSGILTLSGSNNYTGATNINAGALAIGANNALTSTNTALTIASGARLTLNNYSTSIGSLAGSGTVALGTGTLTVGTNNLSTTFSGSFAGGDTGTFAKTGTGTLTLGAGMNLAAGTLVLHGGTLNLNGTNSTFGSLSVTADSVIDFGTGGASILNILNSLTITSGVTLTINDWTNGVDYFYAGTNPGATYLGQIAFSGYGASSAQWQSFDKQITPVPEPPACGAVLMGIGLLIGLWRRRGATEPFYGRCVSRPKRSR